MAGGGERFWSVLMEGEEWFWSDLPKASRRLEGGKGLWREGVVCGGM